jgi:hypothetical protein
MKITSSATARVADEVTCEMEQVLAAYHHPRSVGTDGTDPRSALAMDTISISLQAESLRRNQPASAPGRPCQCSLAQPTPSASR